MNDETWFTQRHVVHGHGYNVRHEQGVDHEQPTCETPLLLSPDTKALPVNDMFVKYRMYRLRLGEMA